MCLEEPTPKKYTSKCCSNNPKRVVVHHPSNSKKGIAIKGTNIRVSIFNYYQWT